MVLRWPHAHVHWKKPKIPSLPKRGRATRQHALSCLLEDRCFSIPARRTRTAVTEPSSAGRSYFGLLICRSREATLVGSCVTIRIVLRRDVSPRTISRAERGTRISWARYSISSSFALPLSGREWIATTRRSPFTPVTPRREEPGRAVTSIITSSIDTCIHGSESDTGGLAPGLTRNRESAPGQRSE
jgi:hypothetical protein